MVTQGQQMFTRSRNGRRYGGGGSRLISGGSMGLLYLSNSDSVGIRILIVRCLVAMEHLNYACHP